MVSIAVDCRGRIRMCNRNVLGGFTQKGKEKKSEGARRCGHSAKASCTE